MIKKAVFFDLDNTLYDYNAPHKLALKEVYKVLRRRINLSKNRFMKLYDLSKTEIQMELSGTASAHNRVLYFQRLIEKTHNSVEPKIILNLYDTYWGTFLKKMKLAKGVTSLIKEIRRRGIKTAIVSDLTTNIQLRKMQRLKIGNFIDVLVTSEEAGSEKPHSIMFLLALKKLDMLPRDAIMVGDNIITDIEGANAVNIDTVLIQKGKKAARDSEDYENPDYLINNISEVISILDKIERKEN